MKMLCYGIMGQLAACVAQLAYCHHASCCSLWTPKLKADVHLVQPVTVTMLLPFKCKTSQSECQILFIIVYSIHRELADIFDSCHHQFVPFNEDLAAVSCQRLCMKIAAEGWHPVQSVYLYTYVLHACPTVWPVLFKPRCVNQTFSTLVFTAAEPEELHT